MGGGGKGKWVREGLESKALKIRENWVFLFIQSTFWSNEIIKELSENGTLNFCINHNILDCSTLSVLIFHVLKNI